ncbi:MAG: MBL fold metallo-hydrolase [Promethearchaeota archaeon]
MELQLETFNVNIVFDNNKPLEGFLSSFGFSVLIYNSLSENYLLFDTGSDGAILLHNLEQLGVDASEIRKVVISHNHIEHSGGLKDLYEKNNNIEIYVPIEVLNIFRKKYSKSILYGVSDWKEIDENIYLTGQLGTYLKEQALFLKTLNNELIVMVGCCHPGLDEILSLGRQLAKIRAIIGGFHNTRNFSCLEGIKVIGACHCTHHVDLIKQRFPEEFREIYVGDSLTF